MAEELFVMLIQGEGLSLVTGKKFDQLVLSSKHFLLVGIVYFNIKSMFQLNFLKNSTRVFFGHSSLFTGTFKA